MASTLHTPGTTPAPAGLASAPPLGPPMTRCECAGVSFAEVARHAHAERLCGEQAARRAGCGQTCGACIPDLLRFLSR